MKAAHWPPCVCRCRPLHHERPPGRRKIANPQEPRRGSCGSPGDAAQHPGSAMTVRALIAEDEPLLLQGLQAVLRILWPELVIAAAVGDGDSALQQALQHRPEVCFLDIRMPG